MHETLAFGIVALFCIISKSLGAKPELSIQYYIGGALFQNCNRVIYFDLKYSEQFSKIVQPNALHFSPVTIVSDGQTVGLTHEVVWSRRTTCLLHIIIGRTYFGSPVDKVTRFWNIKPAREQEYVLIFIAQPWNMAKERATFRSEIKQFHDSGTKLARMLQFCPNWLVFDVDIETFEVIEANALCLHCTPKLVVCICPPAALLDLSTVSKRRAEFNGGFLYFLIILGFRKIRRWNTIRRLTLRKLLSGGIDYTVPLYKVCSDIGEHLNATMKTVISGYNIRPIGAGIAFGAWRDYAPRMRELTVALEGARFVYCTNRTEAFVGDARGLFAPFDSGTWTCILTALGGLSAILRISHSKTHLFHLMACLVSQGRLFTGKLALLWALWMAGSGTLQNFYTSFIESVLVVPPEASTLNNFEQLYAAGYHIVMGEAEPMVKDVKRGLYGGTPYMDALTKSVEYQGKHMFDRKFLSYALSKEKKAFLIAGTQAPAARKALRRALPRKNCHVSKTELPIVSRGWTAIELAARHVQSLCHRLFVSGILKLLMESSTRRWNNAFERKLWSEVHDTFYGTNSGTAEGAIDQDSQKGWRDDGAALDFAIGSSQLKMIFVLWLSTLGLSIVIFCVERRWGKMGKLIRCLPSCRTSSKEDKWAASRAGL